MDVEDYICATSISSVKLNVLTVINKVILSKSVERREADISRYSISDGASEYDNTASRINRLPTTIQ